MLHLVRHADAGDRQDWSGPDDRRPLTGVGRLQARGLVAQLDGSPVAAILSSPALRCVQSVQPLAAHRGLPVRVEPRLDVDADPAAAVRLLLADAQDHTVLCTHGELIGQVLTMLGRRGAPIGDHPKWPKGSVWQLDVVNGAVVRATYLPPASV